MAKSEKKYDVFISHASEDKDSFVRPLAVSLTQLGAEVWYDEFSLRLGDRLSRSIDRGLADSRFGLVVVSPHFIEKPWPEYELSGLTAREIDEGRVILPIWHRVSREQVVKFSPPLADKWALRTKDLSAEDIAIQVLQEIRPDIYKNYPRSKLAQMASGQALRDLQHELELAKNELAEYRCSFCEAPMCERMSVPLGPDCDGLREIFECGFQRLDGCTEQPCPADPKFPKFSEYDLQFHQSPSGSSFSWLCLAIPITDMARRVSMGSASGRTKEEAEQKLKVKYDQYCHRTSK